MTASEKSTSIDTNMLSTNDANSCANFGVKSFTASTSFVPASESLSTVAASVSNGSDPNNCSKLGINVSDSTSTATPAVSVGRGSLSLENSINSIASCTLNEQVSVSPCDKELESEKQYTRFSIDSIMNERKDSTVDELEIKKLVSSMRLTSDKPRDDEIQLKKPPANAHAISDKILTPEPDRQFNDYAFCDKSFEVKHPQTPLNKVPVQSHSPQLPEPPFAYPVQEESMSESMAIDGYLMSLPHTTSQSNSEIDNKNHSAKEKNAYRFSRRDERHLDNSSGTTGHSFALKKVSKTNITRAKKKKLAVCENNFTVLNIPNVLRKEPSVKRRKLSKIDVAVLRKKQRAQIRESKKSERRVNCGLSFTDDYEDDTESYDSDSEDGKEVDLLVKSGPACKLDLDSRKLEFLEIFRLTTHIGQNSIELQKMLKRKWIIPDVVRDKENTEVFSLNLPVPSNSLSDKIQNHSQKSNFLQLLGLGTVATAAKQEMEEIWSEVVKERLRRKCESSLTKYYQKVFKATTVKDEEHNPCRENKISLSLPIVNQYKHLMKEQTQMLMRSANRQNLPSRHFENKAMNVTNVLSKLSRVSNENPLPPNLENLNTSYVVKSSKLSKLQQYRSLNSQFEEQGVGPPNTSMKFSNEENDKIDPHIIQGDCHQNTMLHLVESDSDRLLKDYLMIPSKNVKPNKLPIAMLVIENQGVSSRSVGSGLDLKEIAVKPSFHWPGLMEIKEAYEKYSKETNLEMVELKEQGRILADETSKKQAEVKFLERKQGNIYTTLSRIDREKKELLRAIDQLTHFINYFR